MLASSPIESQFFTAIDFFSTFFGIPLGEATNTFLP